MTTTEPPCVVIDVYDWPIACDAADPCMTGYDTTLYTITACTAGNPPLVEWCVDYPGHPACTTTVEAGSPPTLPPGRDLPDTGGVDGGLVVVALALFAGGAWLARAVLR